MSNHLANKLLFPKKVKGLKNWKKALRQEKMIKDFILRLSGEGVTYQELSKWLTDKPPVQDGTNYIYEFRIPRS